MTRKLKMIASAGALMCTGLLGACGADDMAQGTAGEASEKLASDSLADLEGRVADDAVLLMEREQFPDTHKKLGAAQFGRANDLTRWAALAAAEHRGLCDRVDMINISGSATRDQIVWYADCANGARVNINQEQAEDMQRRFEEEQAK